MRHYICSDRYQKCEKIGQRVHLLSREIRGVNRKTIIPLFSPKRYRECQEPDFPTEERLPFVQPLSLASLAKAGLRLPASAALRLRLAGRCPNSSSLFPPLAAVVAVAPKGEPLACRSAFVWTSKARCLGSNSAPLSRPATA